MTQPIIVAIPARNEEMHIGPCLQALAAQHGAAKAIAAVVLHANNCTDQTVAAARAQALPFPVRIIEAVLPPGQAHIGHARRGATDAAMSCIEALGLRDAIIASTDADSRVRSDWLGQLLRAFEGEVGAVCGAIDLDGPIPPALSIRLGAEAAYAAALARMNDLLDPQPHDPWPNHIWCWGANIAVRASLLNAIGGSPLVELAEDRALHAELLRQDIPVRHSLAVRVHTSSRTTGRAPGGLADLMQCYATDPSAVADFALEPADLAWNRAEMRGIARRRFGRSTGFGAWWANLEAADRRLQPRRIALADLPGETARLSGWLNAATSRSGNPACFDAAEVRRQTQVRR
ncbi:MAG: glycosyltransferase [Sandaracinobacteroides sp.]